MLVQENEINKKQYSKGIFSDFQAAWNKLKRTALRLPYGMQSMFMLHIDDGMSWESVRDLNRMHQALTSITILIEQEKLAGTFREDFEVLLKIFDEILALERIT